MQPKVSIIVPVYNAENYLSKCINSILGQTIEDLEIILIDDGSTDNSMIIINDYKNKDNRVKVIEQNNSGPSVARNNGIKAATGKYIGFVDSDDYIESSMYEKLFTIAENNSVQIAMCNYREVHCFDNTEIIPCHNLETNKVYNKENIEKSIISTFSKSENYGFYSMCNKIYDRQWILNMGIFMDKERDHGEDWWFNIQLFMKLDSFICIDEPLYNYIHINQNSLMVKYRENQFELCLDGRKKLIFILPEQLIDYKDLNTRFFYEVHGYLVKTVQNTRNSNNCKKIIYEVLKNKDFIESCNYTNKIPVHLNLIRLLMKNRFYGIVFGVYKIYGSLS